VYIHTILPYEVVFEGIDKLSSDKFETITYNGINMEVEKIEGGKLKIVRILSTSAFDYLRQDIQPGTIIENII